MTDNQPFRDILLAALLWMRIYRTIINGKSACPFLPRSIKYSKHVVRIGQFLCVEGRPRLVVVTLWHRHTSSTLCPLSRLPSHYCQACIQILIANHEDHKKKKERKKPWILALDRRDCEMVLNLSSPWHGEAWLMLRQTPCASSSQFTVSCGKITAWCGSLDPNSRLPGYL